MEKRLIYLDNQFLIWLKELLISTEVDFYLLYKLKDKDILSRDFELKFFDNHRRERTPIARSQGYLCSSSEEENVINLISKEFLFLGLESIKENCITECGLANYFILIDRLGNLNDTHKIIEELCLCTEEKLFSEIINKLIEAFNKEYIFSGTSNKRLTFKEWENLFISTQYLENFNNPIDVLLLILSCRKTSISLIEVLNKLNPDPRAALVEYGIDLDDVSEENVLDYLKIHEDDVTFYAVLLMESYNSLPKFFGKKLSEFIISKNWGKAGKYIFRRVYSDYKRRLNNEIEKIFIEEFDSFWIYEFSVKDRIKRNTVKKSWPEDFLSIGGWLSHVKKDNIDLPDTLLMVEDFSIAFASILTEFERKIPSFISNKADIHSFWPQNPYDIRFQYISTYILFSIISCSDSQWKDIENNFGSICYKIKILYYGSHTASHLAQNISNCLLGLLLTTPIVTNYDNPVYFSRLDDLFELFNKIITTQWIKYTERQGLIWDKEHVNNYADSNVHYILTKLKEKDFTHSLKIKINTESTTSWPIAFDAN